MQKKPDQHEVDIPVRPVFTTFVKNTALKILDDYSLATGRKWQAIRNEIFQTIGVEVTDERPLLTRQDLESWAARKNDLGDEKFKYVYSFLTHPESLKRFEFARASDLLEFGVIERVGGALSDFFHDHSLSAHIRRTRLPGDLDEDTIRRRMVGYEGCFTGSDGVQDYCLSLQRYGSNDFFVCHFFGWPINGLGEIADWDIDRASGFCTIGNLIRLHTKSVITPTNRDMYLVPKIDHEIDQINTVNLILHAMLSKAVENVIFDNLETVHKRLKYIDPTAHTLLLHRTKDGQLTEFIDQFRWNIVL